ncbi:hypothetical protein [Actinokineospora globicatena]|uniref:Uncharacterized protein n=1 Tax=Actinokineospora globicatena TaxID=103729 RepID=A0A9W6QS60_9PSEU|nr:hypothetical protein [Actinokineospora globicatena]GLW95851.1 hypothetical protein Aglo03_66670 [Actinokineospora globicatena]
MRLAMPAQVRQLPLHDPAAAVREYAEIIGRLRNAPPGAAADLEALAAEAVEGVLRQGAFLMAVVVSEVADPALLTGVALEVPEGWDIETADALRDSVEDVGGPDVRQTILVESALGPVVVAQRIPGVEQVRARQPVALQLQAFVPEPGEGRMLLLTLSAPSARGWAAHQSVFTEMVASASPSGVAPRSAEPVVDDSFEHHTFGL